MPSRRVRGTPARGGSTLLMRDDMVLFLAQGVGTGRVPRAPGTAGTLPGVALYLVFAGVPLIAYLGIVAALFVVGVALCERAAQILDEPDPPSVVWDEIVGVMIAMIGIAPSLATLIAGFLAFRLFDIWKPWPIGWVDRRVPGGLGIMLDDVIAGLMALVLMHLGLALWAWI